MLRATAILSIIIIAGCGEVVDQGATDAAGTPTNGDARTGSDPDATPEPSCTNGIQDGDEEDVDCGGSECEACVDCADNSECESDLCLESGSCATTRQEPCTDVAPANATSTVVNVTTVFTSGSGWSDPAECAWSCDADYALDSGSCINQRQVACTDDAPSNATSTASMVTITYTDAGGWTSPASCDWSCNLNYFEEGNSCINSRVVSCADNAPANATSVASNVTITYTTAGGWTSPASCDWDCNLNYFEEGNSCINSRVVSCADNAPANATSVASNVTITYTTAGGWTSPASCDWDCNLNYFEEGNSCINSRQVQCAPYSPSNGASVPGIVTITYTTANGWSDPARCDFTCNVDYCKQTSSCSYAYPGEIRYDTGSASAWFGGDDRGNPRNVGGGQLFTTTSAVTMDRFAFYYTRGFDGTAVTLHLDFRNANGTILRAANTVVPASFNGGWVWFTFSSDLALAANTAYVATSYLVNGYSLEIDNGIAGNSDPNGYPGGYRLSATTYSDAAMSSYTLWSGTPSGWDYKFWMRPPPACMQP